MKQANKVIKNTFFLYGKMAITVFSSLYTTRLVLNALGADDFGIFVLVAGIISMLVFLNSAMTVSSQRFMSYAKGKEDLFEEKSVFNISIILHIIVAFLIVGLLEAVGPYLFDNILKIELDRLEAAKIIYQFMILSTFFTVLSVPYDAVINANEDMLFVALVGIFESFSKLGIAFYITTDTGDKLITYGYLIALIVVITMFVKIFYGHRNYMEVEIRFKKYFNKKLFKKMYSFAGYSLLGISTQMLSSYGQGIVLNMFFGTVVNAAYGIVAQINGQVSVFAFTMLKALNPMITKSEGAGNRKLMLDASFIGMRMAFYLLMLFCIPLILEMKTIFDYWLVSVPKYTIIFGILLLFRSMFEQLYVTLYTSILSVGNIKHFQVYNSILSLLPLPIVYIFFKNGYDAPTLYIVFLFYSLFQAIIYIYFAKKECGMSIKHYFKEVIVKSIIPFIIIFTIASITHFMIENVMLRLISVFAVNFIVYIFVIWMIGLNKVEKEFIMQTTLKIKNKVKR